MESTKFTWYDESIKSIKKLMEESFLEGYKRYKVAQFYDITDGKEQNIKIKDLESSLRDFYSKNNILVVEDNYNHPFKVQNDFEIKFKEALDVLKKQAIKSARQDIMNQKRVKYVREILGDGNFDQPLDP
jgi:hypothetical protein